MAEPPENGSISQQPIEETKKRPTVVGIGASAGGLEALKNFFREMPLDSGIAFVVIQHLDPDHESLMVDLMARYTRLPVVQVMDGMPVEPNCIYMIPPNRYLSIKGSKLHLQNPIERRGMRMPIDFFLQSLAESYQQQSIGILLSGTGSDGTEGLRKIKEVGGMAMVQDPATAQHDGMVRSAIAARLVDFVLTVEEMPESLARWVRHPYVIASGSAKEPVVEKDDFEAILSLVRASSTIDFRYYKKNMLERRTERRMGLNHIEELSTYLQLLRGNRKEVEELCRDFLIGVTSFFREPEAFEVLEERVIPDIVKAKAGGETIRVWVPGCATGEEAYSLAILFSERLSAERKACGLQIFATDMDREALEVGRSGSYPESIANEVGAARLGKFFAHQQSSYVVNKQLRDSVLFASQNLLSAPPFSRIDLISCRNLLIYLEQDIQRRLIQLFHFALNEGGYLYLGSNESIGSAIDLFEPVSRKWRIFRWLGPRRRGLVDFPVVADRAGGEGALIRPPVREQDSGELTRQALLAEYAPAAVLINRKCEVLYYHGDTGAYLNLPSGPPTSDLFAMSPDGLRSKLRGAIHKAVRDSQTNIVRSARIRKNGEYRSILATVRPLKGASGLMLVTFERGEAPLDSAAPQSSVEETLVHQLEGELKAVKDELTSTIDQLETSNENLRAANEEVMSMNEELQSSNEELETSKEELQSLNEELTTVNSELQEKVRELERSNNDLSNLLSSTEIATIFLDPQFNIRRFTPATTKLLNLIPADQGRPFLDLSKKFADPDLLADARDVLATLQSREREVQDNEGRWYIRRVVPYRTSANVIDGIVITFADVTGLKSAKSEVETRRRELQTILDALPVGVTLRDSSGAISFHNLQHRVIWQDEISRTLDDVKARRGWWHANGKDVSGSDWGEVRAIEKGETHLNQLVDVATHSGDRKSLRLSALPVRATDGAVLGVVSVAEDITARLRIEDALQVSRERLDLVIDAAEVGIWFWDLPEDKLQTNDRCKQHFGLSSDDEPSIEMFFQRTHPDDRERVRTQRQASIDLRKPYDIEYRTISSPGQVRWIRALGRAFYDSQGRPLRFDGITADITEHKRQAQALQRAESLAAAGRMAATISHEINNPLESAVNLIYIASQDSSLPAETREMLQQAEQELTRVGQMAKRSLGFFRETSTMVAVDISAIIREVLHIFMRRLEVSSISLKDEMGNLPSLFGYPGELRQLFANLIGNAVDAMAKNGGELCLRSASRRDPKRGESGVVVLVGDTGTGIPPEIRARIFDPFFTTKNDVGTGLGLYVSRSIVEKHLGSLQVRSSADVQRHGTVFRVFLPYPMDGKKQ